MGRGVGDLCLLRPGRRAPNPSAVTHPSMRYGVTPWLESRTQVSKGKLRVPGGTQPGTVLRIKGKGIPRRGGLGRGDQRVEVTIEVPTQLTERQRGLLEELAKELGEDVQPERKSFLEKLRDLFG